MVQNLLLVLRCCWIAGAPSVGGHLLFFMCSLLPAHSCPPFLRLFSLMHDLPELGSDTFTMGVKQDFCANVCGAKQDICSNIWSAKQYICSTIMSMKKDFCSNILGVTKTRPTSRSSTTVNGIFDKFVNFHAQIIVICCLGMPKQTKCSAKWWISHSVVMTPWFVELPGQGVRSTQIWVRLVVKW